jgi:hypothetical protein
MRRGLKGTPGHQRDGVTGAAGDGVEARGLEGVGQAHRRQDGGEPPRQHPGDDLTLPGWAQFYLPAERVNAAIGGFS